MIRSIIFISLMMLGASCAGTKHAATTPGNTINVSGTWIPVKQQMGSMSLPQDMLAKQRLTLKDSTYTVTAESVDKGIVRYNGNKMDIYGKEGPNAGKHFTAIYKYDNNELTICYNLAGDTYPETFDTDGKPLLLLSVFKKDAGSTAPKMLQGQPAQQGQRINNSGQPVEVK